MGLRQVPKPTPERETEPTWHPKRILKPEPGIRSGTNGKPDSTKTRQEAETANPVPSRIENCFSDSGSRNYRFGFGFHFRIRFGCNVGSVSRSGVGFSVLLVPGYSLHEILMYSDWPLALSLERKTSSLT